MTLSEQHQRDVRLALRLAHVPDSVTFIDPVPKALTANIDVSGSDVLKMVFSSSPTVTADFRAYNSQGRLWVNPTELKALVRGATGSQQILMVYPDSLGIRFTTDPGRMVPVRVDASVSAGPRSILNPRPVLNVDSVRVYSLRAAGAVGAVRTEPFTIADLDGSVTRRVKLLAPPDSRVIPDSVDVTFTAEPLIFKSRPVVIEPVNVPAGCRLLTFPPQIEVSYMVPSSAYTNVDPHFRVLADYRSINPATGKVRLKVVEVASDLRNVQLRRDSAEYIIERL